MRPSVESTRDLRLTGPAAQPAPQSSRPAPRGAARSGERAGLPRVYALRYDTVRPPRWGASFRMLNFMLNRRGPQVYEQFGAVAERPD